MQRSPRRKLLAQLMHDHRKSQLGRADNLTRCSPSKSQEGMLSNLTEPHARTSPLDMSPVPSILDLDRMSLAGTEGKKPGPRHRQRIQAGKSGKQSNWPDKTFLLHREQAPIPVCRTCLEDRRRRHLRCAVSMTRPRRRNTHLLLPVKNTQPDKVAERWAVSHTRLDNTILLGTTCTARLPGSNSSPASIVSSCAGRPPNRIPRGNLAEADMERKTGPGGMASSGFDFSSRRILQHRLCR